jgi:hypothetical protein
MEYLKYPRVQKAMFEKTMNTLNGIIQGIEADERINDAEINELQNWCMLQQDHRSKYPFMEIIPLIKSSIEDGILTRDEIDDILWLLNNYLHINPYYDILTSDMHTLQGILHGILSDNIIDIKELHYLREWMNDNSHLESMYPYDEVYSLLHKVLKDGQLDSQEELLLKVFFTEFIDTKYSVNIDSGDYDQIKKEMHIQGVCALGPNIEFEGNLFCFTGESSRMKRVDVQRIVIEKGGRFNNNIVKETDILIVGDGGNPCWAFSCYGRKIEKAINLRKQGKRIIIAHEIDFWDATN